MKHILLSANHYYIMCLIVLVSSFLSVKWFVVQHVSVVSYPCPMWVFVLPSTQTLLSNLIYLVRDWGGEGGQSPLDLDNKLKTRDVWLNLSSIPMVAWVNSVLE